MRLHRSLSAPRRAAPRQLYSPAIAARERGSQPKPVGKGIVLSLTIMSFEIDNYQQADPVPVAWHRM
jgi:hypothetical protein